MSSRYKTLLTDTVIFGIGNLGAKLILFLLVPLYTNYMTEAEYGTADLVFTIAQLLAPFLSLVVFDAVVRFGLSKIEKRENVLLVSIIILGLSAISGLLFVLAFNHYTAISPWKWYLYFYVVLHNANSIEFSYLKAKGKNKSLAAIGVLQTALTAGLSIYLVVARSLSVRGYLLASILSNLIIDIVLVIAADIINDLKIAKFDADLFKRMIIYSSPLILNNVSWWVIHSSDKVMIEAMISVSALGVYTVAAKIPALINVMTSIFQKAWGISAVREYESANEGKYYSTVFRYLFLFTSFACVIFVSVMKLFMSFYVGSAFTDAWHYVPLLLVSAVFASVAAYYGSMYSALKKSVNNMLSTLLAAVVNIIINWIFIPVVGIYGAVIGTVVSYIVIAFARIFDVKRYVNIPIKWKVFIPTCLIIITQAICVSLDFHIYFISIIVLCTFIWINFNDLRFLAARLIRYNNRKPNQA